MNRRFDRIEDRLDDRERDLLTDPAILPPGWTYDTSLRWERPERFSGFPQQTIATPAYELSRSDWLASASARI